MINYFSTLPRYSKRLIVVASDAILLPLALWSAIALRRATWTPDIDALWALFVLVPIVSIPIFIKLGLYRAVIRHMADQVLYRVLQGVTLSLLLLVTLVTLAGVGGIPRASFIVYWFLAFFYIAGSRMVARAYFRRVAMAGPAKRLGEFLVEQRLIFPGQLRQALEEQKITQVKLGRILVGHGWLTQQQLLRMRIQLRRQRRVDSRPRVAIYGTGASGVLLATALADRQDVKPVAFLDDNADLQGAEIKGLKVYSPSELPRLVKELGIAQVLLAIPSANRKRRHEIISRIEGFHVPIKTVPGILELLSGSAQIDDIREIAIDDLLGRDPVAPFSQLLTGCIRDKVVMVTGAGGSIGSELCRQILVLGPKRLILFEISEYVLYEIERELIAAKLAAGCEVEIVPVLGSVEHQRRVEGVLRTHKVQTVYHAAAYKHVPMVEQNPIEGVRNNVFGTWRTAEAACKVGVETFVLISTDKAVRPTNVMGATKRFAELVLQGLGQQRRGTRFCMVRFGNVLGSSGSVVPLFRKQIQSGGPVTVTHPEITRYFMTIPEAAQLVLQAGSMGQGGDVFVLDMGSSVKIVDLAKRMVHLSGLEVRDDQHPDGDIAIEFTGLRPGEKLYEELLIGDNVLPTDHPCIMRAQEVELLWEDVAELLRQLDDACHFADCSRVREILRRGVDGYVPQCNVGERFCDKAFRHECRFRGAVAMPAQRLANCEVRMP